MFAYASGSSGTRVYGRTLSFTTLTSAGVPTISYSTTPGTYIFVNDPENLVIGHFADEFLGANLLYYDIVSGNSQIYFQHKNISGKNIKYAIEFVNPFSQPVTLTVYNKGGSYGGYMQNETWRSYFSSSAATTYTIPSGGEKWFYLGRNSGSLTDFGGATMVESYSRAISIPSNGHAFDGVMKFSTSGTLEIYAMAGEKLDQLTGWAQRRYSLDSIGTSTSTLFPWVTSNLSWIIDNNTTSGNLPVIVRGTQRYTWRTNVAGPLQYNVDHGAVVSDNLPLTTGNRTYWPNTGELNGYWANWGVLYRNTFSVTNKGTRARTISYQIRGNTAGSYVSVYSNDAGGYKPLRWDPQYTGGVDPSGTTVSDGFATVVSVTIQPGETRTFNADHVLGGMSPDVVDHQMVIN